MLIVSTAALRNIQSAIVQATHGLVDQDQNPVMAGTLPSGALEIAALAALQVAMGQVVWPADKEIEPPRRVREAGPFSRWS